MAATVDSVALEYSFARPSSSCHSTVGITLGLSDQILDATVLWQQGYIYSVALEYGFARPSSSCQSTVAITLGLSDQILDAKVLWQQGCTLWYWNMALQGRPLVAKVLWQ
jgi:hypothetical protein